MDKAILKLTITTTTSFLQNLLPWIRLRAIANFFLILTDLVSQSRKKKLKGLLIAKFPFYLNDYYPIFWGWYHKLYFCHPHLKPCSLHLTYHFQIHIEVSLPPSLSCYSHYCNLPFPSLTSHAIEES